MNWDAFLLKKIIVIHAVPVLWVICMSVIDLYIFTFILNTSTFQLHKNQPNMKRNQVLLCESLQNEFRFWHSSNNWNMQQE